VYRHLVPGIGEHWMDQIQPDHFERLYLLMQAPRPTGKGLSPGTAHQVHRTARTAWGEAMRRKAITWNAVEMAKAPRIDEDEIEPFDADELEAIILAALRRRNGVRYVIGLALGCRQGEALGFRWDRLDRKRKVYRVRTALQRQKWQHGCDDPHRCGAKYHKTRPCKIDCKRHTRECPPLCPPDCVDHARWCPQRHGGGLVEVDVKSKAGRRSLALPVQLFDLIVRHEKVQQAEREHAGTDWHEGGWMFTGPTGQPLDPRRDLSEWHSILEDAGVRAARLHDARHTAATVLLLLGVDRRVVMDIMGWSTITMAERYEHVTPRLRHDVAEQLNRYFWKGDERAPDSLTNEQRTAIRRLAETLPETWRRSLLRMLDDRPQR
jgi:integrase